MDDRSAAPATGSALDDDVARWCELAEQRAIADAFQALAASDANAAGATVGTAGPDLSIYALTALDLSFFNRVVGLGVGVPATEAQVDAMIAFYDGLDQRNVAISLSPRAQPSELEAWLGERGFTLGHFPQSVALSTVGGWIAARSAGLRFRFGITHEWPSTKLASWPQRWG